jgi:hypothetical protein
VGEPRVNIDGRTTAAEGDREIERGQNESTREDARDPQSFSTRWKTIVVVLINMNHNIFQNFINAANQIKFGIYFNSQAKCGRA